MSDAPLPPYLDPRGRHRGHGGHGAARLAAARPLGRVIGSIISIGLLVVAGYFWYMYRSIDKNVQRVDVAVGQQPSGSTDIDGKDLNILVVGNDDRQNMTDAEVKELHVGRDGGSLATDTMMIVHVPANGAKATLISLPRDTVVDIPDGYRRNKLNSPYASAYTDAKNAGKTDAQARAAGANLLIKTITNLTGLTINHYVQVDLLGFYRIATALDGIPVNMCKAVDDRHSTNVARGEDGGSGLVLSAGKHTLDGLQSLEFVRQRHGLEHGDLDRVKRQQYFLTAAFRKVASVGILFQINALGDALNRSVYFDPGLNLLDLARQLQNLTAGNIIGKTIPTFTDEYGNLTADPAKVQTFVDKLISPPAASPSTPATTSGSTSKSPAPTSASPSKALDSKCIY